MHDAKTSTQANVSRWALYAMAAVMGGCGLAYEYTFSKISSDLLGNSAHQWALIIGLMMLFMGIGSEAQKYLKERLLFEKFVIFEIALGLLGGFGPILLLYVFGESREYYALVQYTVTASVGLLIGLEIPILARLNEKYTEELKANIGGILRWDYIGAFVGALAWVFLLVKFRALTEIGFVLGGFNVFAGGLALWRFRALTRRPGLLFGIIALSIAALMFGLARTPQWTFALEQKLFYDPIIYTNTTKYQHIVLTRSAAGEIFCYINGNTQFSSFDEFIYHEFLTHPAMLIAPARRRVLILGGGDGLGLREVLKYDDVHTATLVDLDPDMTELARTNPYLADLNRGSLDDARTLTIDNNALIEAETAEVYIPNRSYLPEREGETVAEVRVINVDAVQFVDQIPGYYDVIILDFPDPNSLELSKLYSVGFYRRIRSRLAKGGIIIQQATSPFYAKEAFLCIGRTLKEAGFAVVPIHENVPTFGEWGWWVGGADRDYTPEQIRERIQAVDTIPVTTRYMNRESLVSSLNFGKNMLTARDTSYNTILNNVIYRLYAEDSAQLR